MNQVYDTALSQARFNLVDEVHKVEPCLTNLYVCVIT